MTRLSRRVWWAVLGAAATGLLLSLVVVARAPAEPPAVREVRGAASAAGRPVAAEEPVTLKARPGDTVGRSTAAVPTRSAARDRGGRPVRLRVPGAALDARVVPVGVADGRQMRLPDDPRVLGWYRFGAAPRSGTGSVVLAGHVDSREYGVGPLARLSGVRAGDVVEVALGPGRRSSYRVDSVERFDRQALPTSVFARTGPERLRIVTCTGPYLPEQGGYQQNLVVTAVPA